MLQLGSFIQAFRCRNLPNHLNEAMNIVYASFTVTVSFVVMFPICHFQENQEDCETAQMLVLIGNSLVLLLMMYGKKVFIMLLRPQKNTRQYFRRKQMEELAIQAKRIGRLDRHNPLPQ